jgi:putative tryptophan/tyrosine transport system substrate-binding protein
MHRRTFVSLIGGAGAAWAGSAFAQPAPLPIVGFVNNGSQKGFANLFAKFRQGLGDRGFIEGQTVGIEARWADGRDDRLHDLISELVERRASVIVATGGSRVSLVARAVTTSVPVVFVMGGDPVKLGLVKSLNKPASNLTGVSVLSNGLLAKQIAILHETIARAATIGFLVRPANPNAENDIKSVTAASEALGHRLVVAKANSEAEIASAVAGLVQSGSEALVIFPDVLFASNVAELAKLAESYKLPAIYNVVDFATAGGLLCYGADENDAYRQAGIYAARILKGEKPEELPVMQSSRFELVLNLKTAKAFGMSPSPTLLATVDQVIE